MNDDGETPMNESDSYRPQQHQALPDKPPPPPSLDFRSTDFEPDRGTSKNAKTTTYVITKPAMIIALSILALGLVAFFIIVTVLPSGIDQGEHRAAPPSSASPKREARPADTSPSTEQSTGQESESTPDKTVASDPETTGVCPEGQPEAYMGTTDEYTVRICDASPNSDESTYVGGSDKLGYVVLPATVSHGSSGTTLTAENGSTSYKINYLGLTIFKNDEKVKDQKWQSGNMEELHPGGD